MYAEPVLTSYLAILFRVDPAYWIGSGVAGALILLFAVGYAVESRTAKRFEESATGALLRAARIGDVGAAAKALDEGADIDGRSPKNAYPLGEAVSAGHTQLVRFLLDRGANPDGWTRQPGASAAAGNGTELIQAAHPPLFHAAASGHTEIVDLLLEKGASLTNAKMHLYEIPVLYLPAKQRNIPMVQKLLQHGADPQEPCGAMTGKHVGDVRALDVCPSAVKQLVKETLDGAVARACSKCGKSGPGFSRDFFAVQGVTSEIESLSGTTAMTSSRVIEARSFFMCEECIEASRKALEQTGKQSPRLPFYAHQLVRPLAVAWFKQSHADPKVFPSIGMNGVDRFRSEGRSCRSVGLAAAEDFFLEAEKSRKEGVTDTNNPMATYNA
jgi:hypothetical protein